MDELKYNITFAIFIDGIIFISKLLSHSLHFFFMKIYDFNYEILNVSFFASFNNTRVTFTISSLFSFFISIKYSKVWNSPENFIISISDEKSYK